MFQAIEQRLSAFLFLEHVLLPPELFGIVRLTLPGQIASKLGFDSPQDPRFYKPLVKTATLVMQEYPQVLFAFVSQQEISFLLELANHRNRLAPLQLLGGMASLASAKLSLQLGEAAAFLPALYQFPNAELVEEYFSWQQAYHRQTALGEFFLQGLRGRGVAVDGYRPTLQAMNEQELQALLVENGLDVNSLPTWQTEGTGISRQPDAPPGASLVVDTQLPKEDDFRQLIQRFLV